MKKSLFIPAILIILIVLPIVFANDYAIEFETELVDGNVKFVDTSYDVLMEQPLILHVTITNPNDVWTNLGSLSWSIEGIKDNKNLKISSQTGPITNLLIPPKSKKDVYILLDTYDSMKNEDKIGSWRINFEGRITSVECFNASTLDKISFCRIPTSKANPITFDVMKESSNVNGGFDLGRILSKINRLDPLFKLIAAIVGLLVIYGYFKGKK